MKKALLWSVIGILIAGVAVAGDWWLARPQFIVLKDGTKLTLLGMTYGKHHVPPKIKINGRSIRGGGARIDSTNDVAVVWIEAQTKPNNWPNFQLVVSDPANTAATTSWAQSQAQPRSGVSIMGFRLDAFPRRSSKIILRVLSFGSRGQQLAKGQFVVSNPIRGSFPQWTPDPLPDAQSDGDLDVTLTNLDPNASSPYNRYSGIPKNDPLNKVVQIGFDVEQKGQPATNWNPIQLVASDATGNNATTWINRNYQDGVSSYMFQSTLWPDEPAWRLRVEFSRTSGFSPDELWTVSNVPVKQGTQQDSMEYWNYSQQKKAPFAQTDMNGIHIKAYPAVEYDNGNSGMYLGDNMGNKVVSIAFNTDPDAQSAGMRFTPLEVTDDQGHKLQSWGSSWGGGNYGFQYRTSRAVQSVNITVAVHKSRFVEFTVKPSK